MKQQNTGRKQDGPLTGWRFRRFLWREALPLLLIASLGSSCALMGLKKNVKKLDAHGVISVRVTPVSDTTPTYALAWRQTAPGKNEMIGFQRVQPNGLVVFLLLADKTYNIGAFADLNGTGIYEGGEPVDYIKNLHPTSLSDTGAAARTLELDLSVTNGLPVGQKFELPPENKELGGELPVTIDAIADLDAPQFSAATGEKGMWKPFDFLRDHGAGIYFLEPYAVNKLPVMFVYGISGSFQDWRQIIGGLDRNKYQPWLFYYPSGMRLDKSANALASGLIALKGQYGFDRMAVVAHSMGGLVSRGAIQRVASRTGTNFIGEFISISTPWGGHQAAEMGVKYLDFPVPSWRDMVPGSDYLKEILDEPLPAGTRYDLIFGYKSVGGMGLPDDNDGVVGVDSELVEKVQSQAASVFGFHLSHEEILHSSEVIHHIEDGLSHVPPPAGNESKTRN